MKSDKKNDEEIIELTEVLDEDDQFADQEMDKAFENFLATGDRDEDEQEEQESDTLETEVDELDFDSLFDQEEDSEGPDHTWSADEKQEEQDLDFQAIDTEEKSEGSEETAQLETLFADLDEQPQEPQPQNASGDLNKDLQQKLEKLTQDLQEMQLTMAAYPSAEVLQQTLLEQQAEPKDRALSQDAEEALIQKACDRFERSVDEKMQKMQQEFKQKLARTEQQVQTLIAETLEQKIQAMQQETAAKFEQISTRLSEQDRNLRSEMHTLTEGMPSHNNLKAVQTELQEAVQSQIQKAVPQAAARIIREEIEKLEQD